MNCRNLNLPISNEHGLNVAQLAEFCEWVSSHKREGLSHQQEAWAVAESIDNCFDVPTTKALACAMGTFQMVTKIVPEKYLYPDFYSNNHF